RMDKMDRKNSSATEISSGFCPRIRFAFILLFPHQFLEGFLSGGCDPIAGGDPVGLLQSESAVLLDPAEGQKVAVQLYHGPRFGSIQAHETILPCLLIFECRLGVMIQKATELRIAAQPIQVVKHGVTSGVRTLSGSEKSSAAFRGHLKELVCR